MFINIDKSLGLDRFDLLVYCYTMFKSLDEVKGYYIFSTDSLLEEMNFKINERNWVCIDKATEKLEKKGKIFDYQYERDSYAIGTPRYEPDMIYFRMYKHEFDLIMDESKSVTENAKLLHYYCWLLAHLDLKTQSYLMAYKFILEGYGRSDKWVKKYNDELVRLGLISVSKAYKDGMYTSNFYKRIYSEETKLDETAERDESEEKIPDNPENIVFKPITYVNSDADAPIEKINSNLAKQGHFYLCADDLINNDHFDVNYGYISIEKMLLQYREKFNGITSIKAVAELNKLIGNSQ